MSDNALMRPRDTVFSFAPEMPAWLHSLRQQLDSRGEGAPPEILGPTAALNELDVICSSLLAGRGGPNKGNRPSLETDVRNAYSHLGERTRQVLSPTFQDFVSQLGKLSKRLGSPQGARVVRLSLIPLRERLGRPETLRASWQDVLSTWRDTEESAEVCQLRLAQLIDIAEGYGHDWSRRAPLLQYVIGDDASVVARFGGADSTTVAPDAEHAGLSELDRLRLCEEVIVAEPERGDIAVWLVFHDAGLRDSWLPLGAVQFFDGTAWPDAFLPRGWLAENRPDYEPPPELSEWEDGAHWFEHIPEGPRVFARVWLPSGAIATARARGHRLVRAMVDLAKTRSEWVLLEGAVTWRERGGWAGSTFRHPRDLATMHRSVHPVFEGTAENLADFRPELVDRLAEGATPAWEAVEDALWTVAVERAPTSEQRVMLGIRSLERTLNLAAAEEESWVDGARRYLRAPWLRHILAYDMFDAAVTGLTMMPGRGGLLDPSQANIDLHQEVDAAVFPQAEPGGGEFSVRGFADTVDRLLSVLAEGSLAERIVGEAREILRSPQAALDRLQALEDRFERLLKRTERQRNAVVHGTGTVPSVLETVEDFLYVAGRYIAQERMRSEDFQGERLIELERNRYELLDQEAALAAGHDPLEVLFS